MQHKSISNRCSICIFWTKKQSVHPPTSSLNTKLFQFFFWSCYNSSLNLETTVTTLYPYFILKNCQVVLIYYSFSLIQKFFLLSIVLFGFSSEYINTTPCHGHTISFIIKIFIKPLPARSTGLFKLETHQHFLPLSLSQISM